MTRFRCSASISLNWGEGCFYFSFYSVQDCNLGQNGWKIKTTPPPISMMEKMARFRCSASTSLNWGGGVPLFLILFCPRLYQHVRHYIKPYFSMKRINNSSSLNKEDYDCDGVWMYYFKNECEGFIRFPNARKQLKPRGRCLSGFIVFERLETWWNPTNRITLNCHLNNF